MIMENRKNKTILLVNRPKGQASESDFSIVDAEVPAPAEGEVLLRTLYLSVDPYMRGRMNDRKSYVPPFALNEPVAGGVIGEVLESRTEAFKAGDIVTGLLPWQLYTVAKADPANPTSIRKVDPKLAPVTTALGVLGMTGLTAYFGLLDIGRPVAGETVIVSGAAGAVGTVVCQIARLKGCRVVAIAGSDEKNRYLTEELGVDVAINYKTATDIRGALKSACPDGVDVYFDNVGGDISDGVMPLINDRARIIICGQISLYNLEQPDVGPRIQPYLLVHSALMQGLMVSNYAPRFAEGFKQLAGWLAEGKLKYAEDIVEGFERTPQAFLGLFSGENLGKRLVKVAD
jgi:NADPH-dependent curcumin reductase CurA